jgi:hypothetical protein
LSPMRFQAALNSVWVMVVSFPVLASNALAEETCARAELNAIYFRRKSMRFVLPIHAFSFTCNVDILSQARSMRA